MGRGVNSRSNLADSNEGTSLETGPNVNRKKNQAELHARQILFEILEQDTVTESRTTHTRTRTHTHTHYCALGDLDDYGPVVSYFDNWCDESYLCLNMPKAKDFSNDFRKESIQLQPTIVHNETVEYVDHFKYLGMIMDSKLKFSKPCDVIFKKIQQRLHFLRKLRPLMLIKPS